MYQEGVWFTLGYTASQIDDHVLSAKAYRQCVTLEPDVSHNGHVTVT